MRDPNTIDPNTIDPNTIDLADYVRPGDRIVWGQACAEPQTLVELLAAQRHRLPGVRCFLGIPAASILTAEHADALRFESYCGTGTNRRLPGLEIVPVHYSALPGMLAGGSRAADVVFVQVSAPDADGRHSLGIGDDYFSAVIDTARVVVAEVNEQVPFVGGARTLSARDWAAALYTSRPPAELPEPTTPDLVRRVAANVAELVPDGATLQFGIGTLPAACLDALGGHRDLGVHSGQLNDAAARLMAAGVVTGARKAIDRGVAIAGFLLGTRKLFVYADRNPAIALRPTAYTHDPQVLAAQHQLVAINAAVEVDLTGQVNAEVAGGRYVGAVGGATDFLRGAAASRGGLPVIALPSVEGAASRIVARLSGPVSTLRGDAGVIVTEYGAADLRGATLAERRERMLAIAHPDHRDSLEAQLAGGNP